MYLQSRQYRLYLGLLTSTPVFRKPARKRTHDQAGGDIIDDDTSSQAKIPEAKKDVDTDVVMDDDDDSEEEEEADGTGANIEELTEDRLIEFLNDPELSTKIFLTHYMREHGLVWCVLSSP